MKRRQTKFFTEQQILDRIDALKEKSKTLLEASCRHDDLAEECRMEICKLCGKSQTREIELNINGLRVCRSNHMRESERLNKTRHRIEEVQLPMLKQALAAMQTQPLPFTEDKSVVLQ